MLSNLEIIGFKKFLVQFGSPRNFLNPIISKLDKHVVLLPINYRASENFLNWTIQFILNWTVCIN